MKTRTYIAKSVSLIILTVVLLSLLALPPAFAQEGVLLAVTGGDNQTAAVGAAYAQPLQVTVTSGGAPVAGVEVQFVAPASGASTVPDAFSAITDANGVASAAAAANWYAGAFEVLASYGGQTAALHLTNVGTLDVSGGSGQSAVVGMAYAEPLQVKVTDAAGPVAGAVVGFVAPSTGASVTLNTLTATTDASGVASVSATANGSTGDVDVLAQYGGQTVSFRLTNTPPLTLVISGGDDQSAAIGTAYALPLQVTITDGGAPVVGAVVEFAAPTDPEFASLTPATFTATTDANGVASAAVTANEHAGVFAVFASYSGQTATFFLTNSGTPTIGDGTVTAVDPYAIPSSCEFNDGVYGMDPRAGGNAHVCISQATITDCVRFDYCWWRDTTNQNKISQNTADEFTDSVTRIYNEVTFAIYDYISPLGPSITFLTTNQHYMIVGCGGGADEANYIKSRLANYISGKTLTTVVMPDAKPETVRGCKAWLTGPTTIYASARFGQEMERRFFVESAQEERQQRMLGTTLPWGSDAFIGSGIVKEYRAVPTQAWIEPSILISSLTDVFFDGIPITLIPMTLGGVEDLVTYVPDAGVAIIPNWGKYLPDLGTMLHPYFGLEQAESSLDYLRTLSPLNTLIPLNGRPIVGPSRVTAAVLAQRDALQYIRVATVNAINQGVPLADMMATITLPASLASNAYVQELASTVPMLVRNVYSDYMGSFDGRVDHLETLTTLAEAQREVEFGGGENAVLNYVKKCLSEHTHEGALEALRKLSALQVVCPSERATSYYIQALKMLAYDAKSAYIRNYYLSEIQKVSQ